MTTTGIAIAACLLGAVAPPALAGPSEHVPGEVLVKFRADATPRARAAAVSALAHSAVADLHRGWTHVRVKPGEGVLDAVAAYAADPAVEHAQPNYVYRSAARPNDFSFGQLWGLENTGQTVTSAPLDELYGFGTNPGIAGADIHVLPAWSVTSDCSGVVVAVVDSGVNHGHEDLAANMWNGGPSYPNHGWDYVDGDDDPMDLNGHGTHVAGTIGAVGDNGLGVAGACWKASIMAVRALDAAGMGSTASIIQAVKFAVDQGAKVINMSLGGGAEDDDAFGEAIAYARDHDVVVVVAAGNSDSNNDATGGATYPCNFTHANVVCVAALDQRYGLASFSNWGAKSVDVGAPGTNVLSTWAGSHSVTMESNEGWLRTSTTAPSGGWDVARDQGGNAYHVDPRTFPSRGRYNAGTDDRVWQTFDLSGADAVSFQFGVSVDLAAGDWLRAACSASGGDPFLDAGNVVAEVEGVETSRNFVPWGIDVSTCRSATATVGFQLQSAPSSPRHWGVAISPIAIVRLALDGASYNTTAGTSMATPLVAGVAALVRSYNTAYTYADVVGAIRDGRPVASLARRTTTGKAVDAMRALAHIQPPTGFAYVVH